MMEHQCLRTQRDAARLLGGRRPRTLASMSSGNFSIDRSPSPMDWIGLDQRGEGLGVAAGE
jgi:hypothetical protein